MDILFHKILARVQVLYSRLIPNAVNVDEEYGVYRSLYRGATAEAQNIIVPKEVINANKIGIRQEISRGRTPGMSMIERYSEAKASVPTLVKFSEPL